jgi:hypothetical protein
MSGDEPALKLHVVLENPRARTRWWDHAIARALGAFLLTTVLASVVGACWQRRHWAEQQAYDARNQKSATQVQLAGSVVRRISEAFSASNQVIYLTLLTTSGPLTNIRRAQLRQSLDEWIAHNQKWRIEEKVLVAETMAHFRDRRIGPLLEHIIKNGNTMVREMTQFVEVSQGDTVPGEPDPRRAELEAINQRIFNLVAETTGPDGLLSRLATHMLSEARAGQQEPAAWRMWP